MMTDRKRRSIRIEGYDYAGAGSYFVTICTRKQSFLFGEVVSGKMITNEIGDIVEEEWIRTLTIRRNVKLDVHIVMPNHIHGIITIVSNERRGVLHTPSALSAPSELHAPNASLHRPPGSLGAIISGFKAASTRSINEIGRIRGSSKGVSIWQRNYYEHVIRDERELDIIREYIVNNPAKWMFDRENPDSIGKQPLDDLLYKEKR